MRCFLSGRIPLVAGFLIPLAGLCFPTGRACAQMDLLEMDYRKDNLLRIDIDGIFDGAPTHGYLPVRVFLRNGTSTDRTWNLSFNLGAGGNRVNYTSSFKVSAKAGQEIVHEVMVPVPITVDVGMNYQRISVEASTAGYPTAKNTPSKSSGLGWAAIGLSEKLANRNTIQLDNQTKGRGRGYRVDAFGQKFQAESLPEDWRGYTSLDVLMISDEEWNGLSAGARRAINEWVRLGGILDIFSEKSASEVLPSLGLAGVTGELSDTTEISVSLGSVRVWKWNGEDLNAKDVVDRYEKVENRGVYFGQDYRSRWGLENLFGTRDSNPWLVILLLIAFGIIVGPVNLFVWAKPGRRHRLFFTTPVISIVASGLILLLILFNDGIGGKGRRVVLANLQPEADERRLYVTQEQLSRTGVLIGSGFEIAEPVFLSPVVVRSAQFDRLGSGSGNSINFEMNGRAFQGDWYESRSEQGQFLQTVRTSRSRIELKEAAAGADDPPTLFSSLEFTIDELFYHDSEGKVWKSAGSGGISGGQEITLVKTNADDLEKWWRGRLGLLSDKMRTKSIDLWNRRGHFFAVSSDPRAGFTDTLDSITWENDVALIYGTVPVAGTVPDEPAGENPPN